MKEKSKVGTTLHRLIELVSITDEPIEEVSIKIKEAKNRKSFLIEEISRLSEIEANEKIDYNALRNDLIKRMGNFQDLISSNISDGRKVLKHLLTEEIKISPSDNKNTITYHAKTHAGRLMEPIDEDDHMGLICS